MSEKITAIQQEIVLTVEVSLHDPSEWHVPIHDCMNQVAKAIVYGVVAIRRWSSRAVAPNEEGESCIETAATKCQGILKTKGDRALTKEKRAWKQTFYIEIPLCCGYACRRRVYFSPSSHYVRFRA
jgi:hypothetical protein